jgi:DNA sulfur modification protein DndD
MILTRLTVENFGVFRGQVDIDLSPRRLSDDTPPVILFGGKNGAGKTTLLEAVRLCLYGRNALGSRVRKIDYNAYLQERIHRPSDNTLLHQASVQLGFEFVHAGVRSVYDAKRLWNVEGKSVQERVYIYKDGCIFQDVDDTHWDEFLRDLIPPGIANLFFFDGEQIQALADEDSEAEALETAVGGLLNINLVDRLKADLDLYVRQQEQQERSRLQKQAEDLYNQAAQLEQELSELKQDKAGLTSRLDQLRKRTETARQALVREGANFLQERARLEAEQKEVERHLERTRNAIRELASELLPFAVTPSWSRQLRQRLQSEAQLEERRLASRLRKEVAEQVKQTLLNNEFQKRTLPKVASPDWARFVDEITNLLATDELENDQSPLHSLSVQRREQIIGFINQVLDEVPRQMEELGRQLEELEEQQRRIAQELRQVPDEALANPLIEEFQNLAVQTGEINQQISDKDEVIRQFQIQLDEVERVRKKTWIEIATLGDIDLRVERAAKIQVILDDYKARITAIKLEELQGRVAEYFNRLCRKQQLIRSVAIDPDHYRVTLYTDNGEVLPKASLSAGERQLYAMSLLWALRSVSGRQLPIIVDTPMGRLDTDHRHTLLTEFFPHAAHQLVLLSTDTELDAEGYELLSPSISRSYLLNFSMDKNCTEVEERYFTETETTTS